MKGHETFSLLQNCVLHHNKLDFHCRQACYGSGEASFPALLPLLTLLPEALTTDADSMCQLLDAVITGCATLAGEPSSSPKTMDAAVSSYVECWFFLVVKVCLPWCHPRPCHTC